MSDEENKGGNAPDNGGVSSAADTGSPVPSEPEQKSTVGGVMDTVKSMIPGLSGGSEGETSTGETSTGETSTGETTTGEPSTDAPSTTGEATSAPSQSGTDSTSEEAAAGGATGAAGAAAATTATAPAVSEYPKVISTEEEGERKTYSATDSTSNEAVAGGAGGAAATTDAAPAVSEYPKVISAEVETERKAYNTTTTGETSNISASADPSSGNTATETVTSTAATGATSEEGVMADSENKDDQHEVEHKPNEGGGPGEQQEPEQKEGASESHKQKEGVGATRENKDAIPTAGGERLGEKHWGESKMVPDVPKTQQEEQNVSSAEGQPDKQTADNTAANTGGAAPAEGDEGGEGKQKFTDKIKDKLNIGSKKE